MARRRMPRSRRLHEKHSSASDHPAYPGLPFPASERLEFSCAKDSAFSFPKISREGIIPGILKIHLGFWRRGEPQAFLSTVANKSPATQEADQCKSALASQLDR